MVGAPLEALAEAQGIDLAFDNYREDIRLGHKKIFYSADICRKVVDQEGVEHSIPPDDDVQSQFVTLPQKEGNSFFSTVSMPNSISAKGMTMLQLISKGILFPRLKRR